MRTNHFGKSGPAAQSAVALLLAVVLLAGCDDRDTTAEVDADDPVAVSSGAGGESAGAGEADGPDKIRAAAGPATLASANEEAASGDRARFSLAYPTGDKASSAVLLEKDSPREVRVGQPYEYDIKVTNLTDKPLAGVTVVESVARGFEFESSEPTTRPTDADIELGLSRWVVGELGPKEAKTIRVRAVPGEAGTAAACLAVTYQPTLCTTVQVVNPQLKLTKQGPSQAHICDRIEYRYVVSNTGTGVAKGVVVSETLPDGLTTEDGKTEVVVKVGDLAAGKSNDFTVVMKPAKAGEFTSRAVARSQAKDEVTSGKVTTLVQQPVLAVDAFGPEWQYVDEPVTYTVRVTNKGDAPAREALLRLDAPALAEDARVRQLGTIEPGQTQTVSVTVEGSSGGTADQSLKLTATAASECAAEVADTAVTTVKTIPALLLETVDNLDPVQVGQATTYTITVKNQGSAPANNVAITAELPAELQYVEGSGQTEIKADGQKLTLAPIKSLAPGEVATWWVQAKATKAADVRFRIELNSDYLDKPVPEVEPTRLY